MCGGVSEERNRKPITLLEKLIFNRVRMVSWHCSGGCYDKGIMVKRIKKEGQRIRFIIDILQVTRVRLF